MALIDKASLLMVPSTYEDGTLYNVLPSGNKAPDETGNHNGYDQTRADFTFDRGSNLAATRVNSDGLIEKGRENHLLHSNAITTSPWGGPRIFSQTQGHTGYDGSNDAWLIIPNSTNGTHYKVQSISTPNGVITISVYAKAAGYDYISIRDDSSGNSYARFDLATGVTSTTGSYAITSKIESVGNDWYRCSLTYQETATGNILFYVNNAYDYAGNYVGDEVSGVYFQDFQVEQGLVATDYIETGSTTAKAGVLEDMPRINYDANGENGALLLEPLRSNLVPISEGVPEDTNNVTITENYGTSPEGVQNSLKVQKNGVDENDRIQPIDNYNATLVSGNDYTISCFVKNIDSTNAVTTLACRVSGGSLFRSGYDWNGSSLSYLATGYNAGTRKNIFVEDYGNDWWRIGFTFEADGTTGNFELDIDRRNGSNTTSIETYGWQLEAGSYSSSYIPTHGSAVTRGADTTSDLDTSSILTQSNDNTYFAEVVNHRNVGNTRWIASYDSARSNSDRILVYAVNSSSGYNMYVQYKKTGASNVEILIGSSLSYGTTYKLAVVFDGTEMTAFLDGVKGTTKTIVESDNYAKFDITDVVGENGVFKKLIAFDSALTDAECVTLTTL